MLTYSSDIFNKDNTNTQIVSSNTGVVAVDGTTLKAVGAGTATITVKVNGRNTDSVEITVSGVKTIFRNNPSYTWTESFGFTESWDGGAVTITPKMSIVTAATFNMDAGTEYYAEATFEINPSAAERPGFGLGHFKALNTSIDGYDEASMGRVCYLSMYSNNG